MPDTVCRDMFSCPTQMKIHMHTLNRGLYDSLFPLATVGVHENRPCVWEGLNQLQSVVWSCAKVWMTVAIMEQVLFFVNVDKIYFLWDFLRQHLLFLGTIPCEFLSKIEGR